MKRSASSHSVVLFYVLAFLFSWAGWAPLVLSSHGYLLQPVPYLKALLVLPAAGPALAALIAGRMTRGKEERRNLLRALFQYRVNPVWYVLAAAVPAALLVSTRLIESFATAGGRPQLPQGTASEVLTIFVLSLLANPWEEIGWRGFALPRLQTLFNPFVASLLIGSLSGLWHLPIFYWRESPMSAYPFWPWFVATVCTSFIATWLFNNSAGSLLTVSIFHILLNTLSVLVGINSFRAYAAVSVAFVILLLVCFTRQFRSPPEANYAPLRRAAS